MAESLKDYYRYSYRATGKTVGDGGAKDGGKGIDHGAQVRPVSTYARVKIPAVGRDTRKTY